MANVLRRLFVLWRMILMNSDVMNVNVSDEKRFIPLTISETEGFLFSPEVIEFARASLAAIFTKEKFVGEYLGVIPDVSDVITHAFECLRPGYAGWMWVVSVIPSFEGGELNINEFALLPGQSALLAPAWIPWSQRLLPQDVQATDRLPYKADDDRLENGYESTDDDSDEIAQYELGLGRKRVLSPHGRNDAFERWYKGEQGPKNSGTRAAEEKCSTCGFLMHMPGSARNLFGVCANEWSSDDGRVVSLDHGCGAHSETDNEDDRHKAWDPEPPVLNEMDMEVISVGDSLADTIVEAEVTQ